MPRAEGNASCAPQAPQGKGKWGNQYRINFPQFWVQEMGQTGTMARHNTQNGQKCCDNYIPIQKFGSQRAQFPLFHDTYPNCAPQDKCSQGVCVCVCVCVCVLGAWKGGNSKWLGRRGVL